MNEERREITTPEVRELEEPLFRILQKMQENIDNNAYGFIIVELRSGLIPGLAVGQFINRLYRERGLPPLPMLYVPSSRSSEDMPRIDEEIKEQLPRLRRADRSKKGLIITDYIYEGNSIRNITDVFAEHGISNFDVAVVVSYHSIYRQKITEYGGVDNVEEMNPLLRGTLGSVQGIFYTGNNQPNISIWGNYALTGIMDKFDQPKFSYHRYSVERRRWVFSNTKLLVQNLLVRYKRHLANKYMNHDPIPM